MAIKFMDGFDHYGTDSQVTGWSGPSGSLKATDGPYGWKWADDEGNVSELTVERDGDKWRMMVKGSMELVFGEQPVFMAYPRE